MLKFFLDSSGGSLAFKKEEDAAKFPDTAHITTSADPDLPVDVTQGIDVSNHRTALICVKAASTTSYELQYYHAKKTGVITDEFFLIEEEIGLNGNISRGVNIRFFDYFLVRPVNISGGEVLVEVGVSLWDGSDEEAPTGTYS